MNHDLVKSEAIFWRSYLGGMDSFNNYEKKALTDA